jgi:hypothetical protein
MSIADLSPIVNLNGEGEKERALNVYNILCNKQERCPPHTSATSIPNPLSHNVSG